MIPKVSIITPNYNCSNYISQTIKSVIAQTYSNWEMIIVDDCSTDDSYELALEYSKHDSRIMVLRNEKNSGAALSRNKALDKAQGEYIAFLDSDDLWMPEKLEKQIRFMQKNDCDFSFCRYNLIDEGNIFLGKTAKIIHTLTYHKMLYHDFVGCLTVMYKADIAKSIRSFDIRNNNDYGLFLQVIKNTKKALGMDEILANYRIRKNGISRNKLKKVSSYFELMHDKLHLSLFKCCFYLFTNIVIKVVWKYEKN